MGIRAWLKSKFVKRLPEGEEIPKTADNTREEFMDRIKVGDNGKAPETKDKNGHTKVNEMISYGFAGKCVHLHLPVDLKEDLHTLGVRQTIDKVNLYLVDAIEKINRMKQSGTKHFKNKNSIYMISPALIPAELKLLQEFGFTTKFFHKGDLNNEHFMKTEREAVLARKIFGPHNNVGTASLEFKQIDTEKFQQAKAALVERCNKNGITIEQPEEDKDR